MGEIRSEPPRPNLLRAAVLACDRVARSVWRHWRPAPRPLSKTWSLPPRTYVFTPSLNLSSENRQVWVAPGNSSYLGKIDGQFDVTVLPNETTTVTIPLPESFPEAIKDAAPQSQRPNSAMQLAFKPGTVGDIVQKMKLGLNVESVPDGSASTAHSRLFCRTMF